MATESEKRRGDTSAEKGLAEEAAQRKKFSDEEAAIRKGLRRLSRRATVLNAMSWQWTIPLFGLAGLHLWWRGSLSMLGAVLTFGVAGLLHEWIKKAACDKLAENRFNFLQEARRAAGNHLKRRGGNTTGGRGRGARLFRLLAEHGDARAQIQTGILHAEQIGTVHDPGEAVRWFRRAAELKEAGAMDRLGDCYVRGLGVKRDYGEAIQWYWKARTEGFLRSLWKLGYMYATGMGVEKNLREARRHYSNALTSDSDVEDHFACEPWLEIGTHREAFREIGKACRLAGLNEEALVWLGWAADDGDDEARRECSDLVNHGAAWLRKAAEGEIDEYDDVRYGYAGGGEPEAQIRLGHLYIQGRGVPRDAAVGEDWYRPGIENHERRAFDCSRALRDAPDNVEETVKWLRAKAEAEAPDSVSWWRWVDARTALRRLRRDYT